MGLKDGTLHSLAQGGCSPEIAELSLHHMLQPLEYLAVRDIVHRDVKPQNILFLP
ncbi:hypothetical protein GGR51DRAFT_514918 [Nemania sp. FL0031]|nr:hypothetical protein GGR51DRAFT_514918 [Nemania sp. FL0031]